MNVKMIGLLSFILCFQNSAGIYAQNRLVTLEEAIQMAVSNNNELESFRLKAEQSKRLKGEAFDPGGTNLYYSYDENNVAANGLPLKVMGIEQSFDFPTVYVSRLRAAKNQAEIDRLVYEIKRNELSKSVSKNYQMVLLIMAKLPLYSKLDSLYSSIIYAAEKRYSAGESNYLESLTTRSHAMQLKTNFIHANEDLHNELQKLHALIQSDTVIAIVPQELIPMEIHSTELSRNYGMMLHDEMTALSKSKLNEQRNLLLPGISVEYFHGTNNGQDPKIYPGFSVGVSIPLFFGASNARIQSAKIEKEISTANTLNYTSLLKSRSEEILTDIRKYSEIIRQYNELGKETYNEIVRYAMEAFKKGEIDFHVYISSLEEAINLQLNYLDNLNNYNQAVIELNYLSLPE